MSIRADRNPRPAPAILHRPNFAFWVLSFAALLFTASSHATVRCVATVADLVQAFGDATAGAEGGSWDIRVRPGIYQLSDALDFIPDGDKDNKAFYLSGGWDAGCSNQTGVAAGTVVRGIASTPQKYGTSFLFLGDNARYDIENIRFENFSNFDIDDSLCYAFEICPDTDAIVVDHVEFDNGESLTITVNDAHSVLFRNNLVTNMKPLSAIGSTVDFAPIGFLILNNENPPQISFNTFANITCFNTPGGVEITSRNLQLALHHNIFQTTGCSDDLYIDLSESGQTLTPYYNLLLSAGGLVGGNLANNGNVIDFNPKFVDAFNGNYRLQNASSAVNAGATLIGAIQSGFAAPGADLDSKFRPIGTRYDIGAYESNVNDGAAPVITVNSNDDNDDGNCNGTHCSLREAINLANSQVGTSQRIVFGIAGGCPQVIYLNSALPDITDSLIIDGYTQQEASANDLDLGSDATVCILIAPGASMSHALAVPASADASTQLTVQGLGFANALSAFTTAAIELRSGTDHKLSGNVFGGYLPPGNNPTQIGNLGRAIYMSGTAKNATIGGPANSDRNYFGFMGNYGVGQNGIVLNSAGNTGVRIQNNYIGVQPNGLGVQANSTSAISISGGSDGTIVDNAICASDDGIELLGADTTGFTIQRNNIGVNAAGYGVATHSNNNGIVIGLGSSQHIIGAAASETLSIGKYSNFIDNNNGDGIFISSTVNSGKTAGYNSIRGNLIEANGRSGTGIGIDLGGSKLQLANDAGDADTGANTLQNYPIINGSTPVGAFTRTVNAILNTAPNQAVRVDYYHSATCGGGTKGANAATYVGSTDVNSGPSGIVNVSTTIADAGLSGYLTATSTTNVGHSSELAPCVREDVIFSSGAETPGL